MRIKIHGLASVIILALFLISGTVEAQTAAPTLNDVVNAYNAAIVRTDTIGKIRALEDCLNLCAKVGAPADTLKDNIAQALTANYSKKAVGLYKANKKVEAATAYEELIKVAQKFNDSVAINSARKNLATVYYDLGNDATKSKKFADAAKYYDKSLAINSENIRALYFSANAYSRLNNKAKFEEMLAKTLEMAKAGNDPKFETEANKMAKTFYLTGYSNAYKQGKIADAINNLKTAQTYSPNDKDLYYYLGQAYNTQKKFDLALENLNKSLELETGKPEDKAKIYYALGEAYEGKANVAKACEAFQNAMFGQFAQSAKAKRTNLKCK